MNEDVEFELECLNVMPAYGSRKLQVVYIMKHTKYGRVNRYRVWCRIAGIDARTPSPYFDIEDAEWLGDMEKDSNDETLTPMAACRLAESKIA